MSGGPRGRTEVVEFESRVLRGNALRDPYVRRVPVYFPPRWKRGTPAVLCLSGFTGTGLSYLNVSAWSETLPEKMDRLIAGGAPPLVLVMADCFTRYGGSQYVNSTATGRYEDHLMRELVPWATRAYGVPRWGVFGKSSGGFGAIRLAMRRPDVFSAVACHSGDMLFELCYATDFPKVAAALARNGRTVRGFFEKFHASPKKTSDQMTIVNTLAMAACYSPKGRGFELPFDLRTCERVERVWRRWKAFDPVEMVKKRKHREALRRMRGVFLDCGTRDEFHLQFGARVFGASLRRAGIRHVSEEFEDGHMNIPYRYDRSLPFLGRVLRGR